jgi:hypothetical protein
MISVSPAASVVHGVECYDAWRASEDCPHEAANKVLTVQTKCRHTIHMNTAATTTARRFEVIGTTADYNACDCCGRSNLKRYVVLRVVDCNAHDSGDVVFYGTGCAATAEGIPAKTIKAEADAADQARRAAEEAARAAASETRRMAWVAFLDASAPGLDMLEQIERLGGYAEARAAFRAAA